MLDASLYIPPGNSITPILGTEISNALADGENPSHMADGDYFGPAGEAAMSGTCQLPLATRSVRIDVFSIGLFSMERSVYRTL